MRDKPCGCVGESTCPFCAASTVAARLSTHTHGRLLSLTDDVRKMSDYIKKLEADRERIAQLLARFAAAPISISSIQPLLELNDELNGRPR